MITEETKRAAIEAFCKTCGLVLTSTSESFQRALEAALNVAVAAERERCAKIAREIANHMEDQAKANIACLYKEHPQKFNVERTLAEVMQSYFISIANELRAAIRADEQGDTK